MISQTRKRTHDQAHAFIVDALADLVSDTYSEYSYIEVENILNRILCYVSVDTLHTRADVNDYTHDTEERFDDYVHDILVDDDECEKIAEDVADKNSGLCCSETYRAGRNGND